MTVPRSGERPRVVVDRKRVMRERRCDHQDRQSDGPQACPSGHAFLQNCQPLMHTRHLGYRVRLSVRLPALEPVNAPTRRVPAPSDLRLDGRSAVVSRRAAMASPSPLFPIATARLRLSPRASLSSSRCPSPTSGDRDRSVATRSTRRGKSRPRAAAMARRPSVARADCTDRLPGKCRSRRRDRRSMHDALQESTTAARS